MIGRIMKDPKETYKNIMSDIIGETPLINPGRCVYDAACFLAKRILNDSERFGRGYLEREDVMAALTKYNRIITNYQIRNPQDQ